MRRSPINVAVGRIVSVVCGGKVAVVEGCTSEGGMRRITNECLFRSPGDAAAAGGRQQAAACARPHSHSEVWHVT
jgi:hypothetical protein